MTCAYCQFENTEEEHRCRKCGRRMQGVAVAAPPHLAQQHVRVAVQALGANALAATQIVEPVARPSERPRVTARAREVRIDTAETLDALPRSRAVGGSQPTLFGAELQPKIVPFEAFARVTIPITPPAEPAVESKPTEAAPARKTTSARTTRRAPGSSSDADPQATLDFLPTQRAAPRTLKTSAEAVIFCDAKAAAPIHRATAAALDLGMILIGFSVIGIIFQLFGKPTHLDRTSLLLLGGMLGMVAVLYGALWGIAGTVTPGMRWTNLRLINFDGFPLEGRTRMLRILGCWISVLSGGIGLLWALLDEEDLTWHDHMSKSFPTLQESTSTVVRQR